MKSNKFCPNCGFPLKINDEKYCHNCGKPLDFIKPNLKTIKKREPKTRKWAKFSWILLSIGSLIGLLSLIAPAGSFHYENLLSWDMWMFGYNIMYDWEVGTDIFWTVNPILMGFSLITFIFVIIGNIVGVGGAVAFKKKNYNAYLAAGASSIILIGFTLFYLIAYEIYFVINTGHSFWSLLYPSFAVYGQFIAAAFMIPAFFITRKASKYSEPLIEEVQHEKLYNMLKSIVETRKFSESEKNRLNNELEILSLRIKGYNILQEKLDFLSMQNQDNERLTDGLTCFQQAFDKSTNTEQQIAKIDIYLAEQIIQEFNKDKIMSYLKEISDHTTILLGDILKQITF